MRLYNPSRQQQNKNLKIRRNNALSSSSSSTSRWSSCSQSSPVLVPTFFVACIIIHFLFYISNDNDISLSSTLSFLIPNNNNNERSLSSSKSPIVIAHVVSLIKCKKQSSVTGFLDAAAVLRHSIHKNSIHTPGSGSKYSYQMYAIVHETCQDHAQILERLGYKTLVKESPIKLEEITPGWYKDHVENENCCGSAEFIKLYAYTLMDYPITVHWDMDVTILQPMDELFDSMIYEHDHPLGKSARSKLNVQHPYRSLPDKIDAFFTRDITSAEPDEIRQGVQGGFLVSRPSLQHFHTYLDFIRKGNYVAGGRGNNKGWDGLGYGGFQGAMAYQGVVAYFYDQIVPNTAVELDVCIWNQVVADVIWRGPHKMDHYGECREYPTRPGDTYKDNTPDNGRCKDCRVIPIEQVKTVHYTACKKPWECALPHPRVPRKKEQEHRLKELTNVTTCGLLFKEWYNLRYDFEQVLYREANVTPSINNGKHNDEYFLGYCRGRSDYISMIPPPEDFDITKIYGI